MGCICSLLIHHGIGLHYTHRACTVLWLLKPHLLSNILAPEKKQSKNPTTPSKGFNLKCSRKCLIQRRMHVDCPIIHLCIFSGRQTAESFWYRVRFLGLSVSLSRRKRKGRRGSKERRLQRQTRGYSRAHSGVRLCVSVCVCSWTRAICLLKKAFNRAFISPSMVS